METRTISTRIPVDVVSTIDSICEKQGINRSRWLTKMVAETQTNEFFEKGGKIQARAIPVQVQELLTSAGVATVGILGYNIIGQIMSKAVDEEGNPKFTDIEIEVVSFVLAVGMSVAGYGLIKAVTKE